MPRHRTDRECLPVRAGLRSQLAGGNVLRDAAAAAPARGAGFRLFLRRRQYGAGRSAATVAAPAGTDLVGITATSLQAVASIILAWFGFKYWSIVGGFFIGQTVATLWYWRAAGWRPQLPLRLREGRSLLGYGIDVTFTRVLWHLYMNVDKLIVGKLLGERAVGVYDVSRSLATLPTSQISGGWSRG